MMRLVTMEIRGNNKIKSNRFAKALAIIFLRKKHLKMEKVTPSRRLPTKQE
jgi:hypothetical protein